MKLSITKTSLIILLINIVGCSAISDPFVEAEADQELAVMQMQCSFVSKRTMFEMSVRINLGTNTARLRTIGTRHRDVTEESGLPVTFTDEGLVITQQSASRALSATRQHVIQFPTLTYRRNTLIVMGDTPPISTIEKGACWKL